MPARDPAPDPAGVKVVRYHPRAESLAKAVRRVIGAHGGWTFTSEGDGLLDDPVMWRSDNINSRVFFGPYLRDRRVDYSLHAETDWGVLHGLLRSTLALSGSPPRPIGSGVFRPYSGPYAELAARRKLIDFYLRRLDARVARLSMAPRVRASYERNRRQSLAWVNLIDAELRLRRELGVSFLSQPIPDQVRRVPYALRDRPDALWSYLMSIRHRLPRVAAGSGRSQISEMVENAAYAGFPRADVAPGPRRAPSFHPPATRPSEPRACHRGRARARAPRRSRGSTP